MECCNPRLPVWFLFFISVISDVVLLRDLLTSMDGGQILTEVLMTVLVAIGAIILGYLFPAVSLYDEGVYVRRFFSTQKYEWKKFSQLGAGQFETIGTKPLLFDRQIFMLLPGAVKHDPKVHFTRNRLDAFRVRNLFCMISFPADQEEVTVIQKNYGDFDFEVTIYSIYHKEEF